MYAANADNGYNDITVYVSSTPNDIDAGVNRKDKFLIYAGFGEDVKVGNLFDFLITYPTLPYNAKGEGSLPQPCRPRVYLHQSFV